jgi:hypothetical protein
MSASALETFGHVASIIDISLDLYLTVDFLRSSDQILYRCGVASAFFIVLSLTLNSLFALSCSPSGNGLFPICLFLFPLAFPVAFFTLTLEMLDGFSTHYLPPAVILIIWPLILVCVVDALTNPTGYAAYVKRKLIKVEEDSEDHYKYVVLTSIFLSCVEDIPEIILQGISTTSPAMTPNERVVVYISLTFSIYCVGVQGIRKLFIWQGKMDSGFDDVQ